MTSTKLKSVTEKTESQSQQLEVYTCVLKLPLLCVLMCLATRLLITVHDCILPVLLNSACNLVEYL